jgi:Zn-finger protein
MELHNKMPLKINCYIKLTTNLHCARTQCEYHLCHNAKKTRTQCSKCFACTFFCVRRDNG